MSLKEVDITIAVDDHAVQGRGVMGMVWAAAGQPPSETRRHIDRDFSRTAGSAYRNGHRKEYP